MIKSKKFIQELWRPEPDKSKRSDYYRFERNERTTLFTSEQFNDIISTISSYDLIAYGELEPFYEKIIEWLDIDRSKLLLTSGSDAGIKAVYETFIDHDDEVIITLPNYAMFSVYADMFCVKKIIHYYEKDLTLNVDELIAKINPNTKLVIVSNPGHTGTVIEEEEIVKILNRAKSCEALVLIDEAYHHFYKQTMISNIENYNNLIVSRTFSKAFGLASLRIGLLIGHKTIITELYKVKLVHEITGLSAKIGTYLLNHLELLNQYVDEVNKGKELLYNELNKMGFATMKSESNFIFFNTPKSINPIQLIEYLEKNKILIRGPFNKNPFDNQLRITVGDIDQMDHFCKILRLYQT